MTATETDADLVLAVQAGQAGAFDVIWARHAGRVNGFFAHARGCSPHDAEDLTQEVFLRLFAGARRIRKPAALRHYVMSVANRVFKGHLRSWSSSKHVRLTTTGEVPELGSSPGIDEDARAVEHALGRCAKILSRARARERVAFVSRYFEEMTVQEVADRMGISLSTVKRLNARSLEKVVASGGSGRYQPADAGNRSMLTAASSR